MSMPYIAASSSFAMRQMPMTDPGQGIVAPRNYFAAERN